MKIAVNNVLPISTEKCHQYETQLLHDISLPDVLVFVRGQWVGRMVRKVGPQGYQSTCDGEMGSQGPRVPSVCLSSWDP